jgi:hypothetical protein
MGVAVITGIALAIIGVLAVQASGSQPAHTAVASTQAPPTIGTKQGGKVPAPHPTINPTALPANSGSGKRVVYSLGQHRVWLVSDGGTVTRSYPVVPGTVSPPAGTYQVNQQIDGENSSDGTPVQYVVLFNATADGRVCGFEADANVPGLPPAPTKETTGIRAAQADAEALWNFVTNGTTVVVTS